LTRSLQVTTICNGNRFSVPNAAERRLAGVTQFELRLSVFDIVKIQALRRPPRRRPGGFAPDLVGFDLPGATPA
jgi:hypothetical protein